MAEKILTLIGQMDKIWMDAIEEFDDGAPGCEIDLHVRLAAMEGVLRFVKAQRPKTSEQTRVAVIAHLRRMEKELKREIVDGGGYDDWFWKIAREFERPLGVVTVEGLERVKNIVSRVASRGSRTVEAWGEEVDRIATEILKAADVRVVQKTIEGVYHSEDASGTDRIVTDWSGCVFFDISDEYDSKRIAVHIEVLED